jgi:NarL family two-component system sensor histidine kinase LiaS
LKNGRGNVILEILDDGVGFDVKKVDRAGLGLRNMRERAAQLHGRLQIVSKPDVGTRIVVSVPVDPGIQSDSRGRRA